MMPSKSWRKVKGRTSLKLHRSDDGLDTLPDRGEILLGNPAPLQIAELDSAQFQSTPGALAPPAAER